MRNTGGLGLRGLLKASVAAGALAAAANCANAADDEAKVLDGEGRVAEIVVTGTNIRGNKVTASPVQVIDREELEQRGVTSMAELLATIPQNFASVGAMPIQSANLEQTANLSYATGANLRGLGARATLTLIDGHRAAPTGRGTYFDASTIPLVAVERVEILTDGAAAIYGSDAVAGVINYILRRPENGFETTLRGGGTTDGGYNVYDISQRAGHVWSSGGVMLAAEYLRNDPLQKTERDFSKNAVSPAPLIMPSRTLSLYGDLRQDVNDRLSLSATYLYADRKASQPATGSFQQVAKHINSGTVGAKLKLGGSWMADAVVSYSRDTLLRDTLNTATRAHTLTRQTSDGLFVNASASGTIFETAAGEISGAFGAEYVDTSLLYNNNGPLLSNRSTKQRSAFAEVVVPVFGEATAKPLLKSLSLTGAVRVNDYDAVGTVTNPKVGFVWELTDAAALRGSWGTSFRTPGLAEDSPTGMTSFISDVADPSSPTGRSRLLFLSGSTPEGLLPEKSKNWTLGADFRPSSIPGLALSATYFEYDYTNRITTAGITAQILANPTLYSKFLIKNPTVDQVNAFYAESYVVSSAAGVPTTPSLITRVVDGRSTNVAATTVHGADFDVRYGFGAMGGRINAGLGGTYFFDFKNTPVAGGAQVNASGMTFTPSNFRARGSVGYAIDNWSGNLSVDYVGRYTDVFPGKPNGTVKAWRPINLRVAYKFSDGSPLAGSLVAVSIKNLFDADPPSIRDPNPSGQGPLGYDAVNADPLGRVVSLELRKSW